MSASFLRAAHLLRDETSPRHNTRAGPLPADLYFDENCSFVDPDRTTARGGGRFHADTYGNTTFPERSKAVRIPGVGGAPRRCIYREEFPESKHWECEAKCNARNASLLVLAPGDVDRLVAEGGFGFEQVDCRKYENANDEQTVRERYVGWTGLYREEVLGFGRGKIDNFDRTCGWRWSRGGRAVRWSPRKKALPNGNDAIVSAGLAPRDTGREGYEEGRCVALAPACVGKANDEGHRRTRRLIASPEDCAAKTHCLCDYPGLPSPDYDDFVSGEKGRDPDATYWLGPTVLAVSFSAGLALWFFACCSIIDHVEDDKKVDLAKKFQIDRIYRRLLGRACASVVVIFTVPVIYRPWERRCGRWLFDGLYLVMAVVTSWCFEGVAQRGCLFTPPFGHMEYTCNSAVFHFVVAIALGAFIQGLSWNVAERSDWTAPNVDNVLSVLAMVWSHFLCWWGFVAHTAGLKHMENISKNKQEMPLLLLLAKTLGVESALDLADVAHLVAAKITDVAIPAARADRERATNAESFVLPRDRIEMAVACDLFDEFEKRMRRKKRSADWHKLSGHRVLGFSPADASAFAALRAAGVRAGARAPGYSRKVYHRVVRDHRGLYERILATVRTQDPYFAAAVAELDGQATRARARFPAAPRQPEPHGLVGLYAGATATEAAYDKFLSAVARKSGGAAVKVPCKKLWRLSEKMGMREGGYSDEHSAENCDVVRGSIVFNSMNDLQSCAILLDACDAHSDADDVVIQTPIEIVRVKNRFAEPTAGGWADALVNFRFADAAGAARGHVVEVQLVHASLKKVREAWGAHNGYTQFRTAVQLLEASDNEALLVDVAEERSASQVQTLAAAAASFGVALRSALDASWPELEGRRAEAEALAVAVAAFEGDILAAAATRQPRAADDADDLEDPPAASARVPSRRIAPAPRVAAL
ncbi:hypothetical protein SO694_00001932 [Aureococcus anophagefferens]|uniref:RelA/SpoT domain-containing protein n=1 Tax=Aureococcus anophagefferens TaxID=44056 RepID=A0ABR1GBW5_AURAN